MSLLIPAALSEKTGALALPNVDKSTGPFTCVGCGETLVLRQGIVNRYHFAHKHTSSCGGGESILHRATKRWFAECVGTGAATIVAPCIGCGASHVAWRVDVMAPSVAHEELALCPDGGPVKYRIDVAVVCRIDHRLQASVEVFYTHRIGPEKQLYLEKLAPVFEIIAFNPASGLCTAFECIDPSGYCDLCTHKKALAEQTQARRARLSVLCDTLKKIGCVCAIQFNHCAKTLKRRLVVGLCDCGRAGVYMARKKRGSTPSAMCAGCAMVCSRCATTCHRKFIWKTQHGDIVCDDCVYDDTLIECRLCYTREVDPERTDRWELIKSGVALQAYYTRCPGLCTKCNDERTIQIPAPKKGKSTKRPCTKCASWGTMFQTVIPVLRYYKNGYNQNYDWSCRRCLDECIDCGAYCFADRCVTCDRTQKKDLPCQCDICQELRTDPFHT